MRKTTFLFILGCLIFASFLQTPNRASASYNKSLDTNLEFGVSVGDTLIYDGSITQYYRDVNESESESMQTYMKAKIIKAEVLPNEIEANLTTDLYFWDYDYDFSLDYVNDSAKWIYEDRSVRIINKSIYTLFSGDFTFVVPKDITIEMLISNDTLDVLAYMFMSMESISELEDEFMEDFGDEFQLTKSVSVSHDIDKPYGRSIYEVVFSGTNTTTEEAMQYWLRFETGIKLNEEYGIFEEGSFVMSYGIHVWDTTTNELFVNGELGFYVDYKLIWASNPAYVTEDFLPYWLQDSWWTQNWLWVVGLVAVAGLGILMSWYFTTRKNCQYVPDDEKSWACARTSPPSEE